MSNINLITPAYLAATDSTVAAYSNSGALIAAASKRITNWCKRKFYASYETDYWDPRPVRTLNLKYSPLIQLIQVVFWPDTNPQYYYPDQFDIRYYEARLAFKPLTPNGSFWFTQGYWRWATGLDQTRAYYFAGYGWLTTLTAGVSPGFNVPLPLANTSGYTNDQGPWNASQLPSGYQVVLDSDQPNEEVVTVAWNGTTLVAQQVVYSHSAGAYVSGSLIPDDVQEATAMLVCNMYRGGYLSDLTKEQEQVGRLGGYVEQARKTTGSRFFTEEIKDILSHYRDVIV